jgi:hypothetical protein
MGQNIFSFFSVPQYIFKIYDEKTDKYSYSFPERNKWHDLCFINQHRDSSKNGKNKIKGAYL